MNTYTKTQQKENLAAWLKDLRSGQYPQTRGLLRRDEEHVAPDKPVGFCCLGVACSTYEAVTGHGEWEPFGIFTLEDEGRRIQYETGLDGGEIAYWLGIKNIRAFGRSGEEVTLEERVMELNDDEGADFNEIADFVEEAFKANAEGRVV